MEPAERVRIAEASDGLIDPRVARHGGYPTSDRDNYDFPGMQDDTTWRRSQIREATRFYGCALCGSRSWEGTGLLPQPGGFEGLVVYGIECAASLAKPTR